MAGLTLNLSIKSWSQKTEKPLLTIRQIKAFRNTITSLRHEMFMVCYIKLKFGSEVNSSGNENVKVV